MFRSFEIHSLSKDEIVLRINIPNLRQAVESLGAEGEVCLFLSKRDQRPCLTFTVRDGVVDVPVQLEPKELLEVSGGGKDDRRVELTFEWFAELQRARTSSP